MHALAQLCVRRPVFATMLITALVVVGIFSYFSLGVDLYPKVDIPTVVVTVANPGASPEEIETEISKKIEDAVNTISQVDEVRSVSSESQAQVIITFLLSKNGDVAEQEVQNKINLIVNDLPQTAKVPVVQKFDPDAAPILQVVVSAPRSLRDVTLIADKQIKRNLENAKGVGEVRIVGGAKREIHVLVDPGKLRSYELTITDVFNALRAQNLELPGGSLNAGAQEFTVRTSGRVAEAAQFNQIAIANRNGYVIKVSDIGYAEDSYEEPSSASRLDGVPAVTLVVAKQSGENTVSTADEVRALVSFTLTPMLCSRFLKTPAQKPGEGHTAHSSKESFLFRHLDIWYTRMLVWSMAHRKTMVLASVLVVLSIAPLFAFVGKNFLPDDDTSQYNVIVRAPEGTSLAATTNLAERVAQDIRQLPGVKHTLMTAGGGADRSVNNSSIYVDLKDLNKRSVSQQQLMQRTRDLLKKYPADIHTSVDLVSTVGGNQSNADVQYFVQGQDLDKLAQYSEKLLGGMKSIPNLVDTDTTLRSGKPEVQVTIDRPRAADLGVSVMDIEMALNTLVAGQVASTFKAGEDEYDVRVRAAEEFRVSPEALARMTVPSNKGRGVGLDEVVHIAPGTGPSAINRINRQRQVTLSGNVAHGGSQAAILATMDKLTDGLHMESGYTSGKTGISKELGRTGYYFALAFSLTFIFMYIVLAAQFESFIHPITILLTLPLAIPFGILSLLIAGQTVNIMSGLGLLLLFGIVKKNAILQIDHTNGLRATGMSRYDAIIQANRDRLRPILMTTIALVAGMAPLVIANGTGAATNRSIGVLVVGGQSLCLVLTLLVVPVFYSLFEDLGESFASGRIARILEALRLRSRKTVVAAVTTIIAIASAFGQTAPQQAVSLEPLQELQIPPRVGITGQTKITLSEAIERTLANDPDLRISRIQREEAGFLVRSAQGAYDPVFGISGSRTRAVVPESSILSGTETGKLTVLQWTGGPQLNGITTTGATYSLQFNSSKQQNDSLFNTLNPLYPTSVNLNLTQPLWRGLRFDENRYRIQVARKNRQISNEQLRQRIIEVVTQSVSAYWELDYASHNLDVQVEAVRLAERQYQSNRRLADQGVLAPVDVVAAQTQVATFEQSLFAAQLLLTQAENNLKMLMLPNRNDLMWSMGLVVETPLSVETKPPSLQEAMARALKSRPELTETALALDVNQLDNKLTHEQTKPRIDAFANLSASGLAGVTTPTASNPLAAFFPAGTQFVPTLLMGNYGQSVSTLAAGTFPSAQIGVNVSLPLRNRTAQAQAAISQAEGRRLRTTQEQIGMAIEADVRNALQVVLATQARLDAAALASRSANEQYLSEERQFQAGTSTVFLVLQRQTDLIAARSREVRARADAGEAIANLERATAGTIEARGIKVE